jgi:hypothetical protein
MKKTDRKPYIQFPVRLNHSLNKMFTEISETTHITKSELIRISIQNLIEEISKKERIKNPLIQRIRNSICIKH